MQLVSAPTAPRPEAVEAIRIVADNVLSQLRTAWDVNLGQSLGAPGRLLPDAEAHQYVLQVLSRSAIELDGLRDLAPAIGPDNEVVLKSAARTVRAQILRPADIARLATQIGRSSALHDSIAAVTMLRRIPIAA